MHTNNKQINNRKTSQRHTALLYLLDVVVEAGLILVVEDALAFRAEVEAVQHVPKAAHLKKTIKVATHWMALVFRERQAFQYCC